MRSFAIVGLVALLCSTLVAAGPAAPPKPTPAEEFQAMQGAWKVSAVWRPSLSEEGKLPGELGLDKQGQAVSIDGKKLIVGGKHVATMENDLKLPKEEQEIGFTGFRLIRLTLPSGKSVLCSYTASADKFKLAYTHRCSCHRGSGHIIDLERVKK